MPLYSTKPKPKEKEYIVPFIGKNRWRLPDGDKTVTSENGEPPVAQGKTEEEMELDREAAEAVLRGKSLSVIDCI